jgi:hypothetical protein
MVEEVAVILVDVVILVDEAVETEEAVVMAEGVAEMAVEEDMKEVVEVVVVAAMEEEEEALVVEDPVKVGVFLARIVTWAACLKSWRCSEIAPWQIQRF